MAFAQDVEKNISIESPTLVVEFANDLFFGKDNKISSGWAIQKHSSVEESWSDLEGLPKFIGKIGANIPTLTKKGLFYRSGLSLGQVLQTPNDLSRSDLIEDDVPYAGALVLQSSWYAFNNEEFRGFELTLGVVGPLSLAEQTQKTMHKILANVEPEGWDNQLSNEPVINFTYMLKRKVLQCDISDDISFDTSICGDVGLGNMVTQAGATIEMRMGHNMPGGFTSCPNFIGLGMNAKASLSPPKPEKPSYYLSFSLCGNAFAHNIFLDGNTFTDSHSVDKEPFTGQIIGGVHLEYKQWGIHFYMMTSTDNVDTSTAPVAEGRESLGCIMLEWHL